MVLVGIISGLTALTVSILILLLIVEALRKKSIKGYLKSIVIVFILGFILNVLSIMILGR